MKALLLALSMVMVLSMPFYCGHRYDTSKAKVVATLVQIDNLNQALRMYKADTGSFPDTDDGLQALRLKPANVKSWNGPYLGKEIPLDFWGHPYLYRFPGKHGNEPDLISYGADGQPGGEGVNADIESRKNN